MYNTYDLFLGSWWGGIIGQSLVSQSVSLLPEDLFTQPWLKWRSQIAQMLLEQEPNNSLASIAQSIEEEAESGSCLQYNSNLLFLLPLIIFYGDRQVFTLQNLDKYNFKPANLIKGSDASPNVLLWSYLLTTVLSHQTDLLSLKLTTEAIFNYSPVSESPVAEKLKLVEAAIERGITFEEIKAKLSAETDLQSTAIALSWYCFVSTPYNSNLSIQRAARVEPNLSWLTTALTGTLSGAYNGMASISISWRIDSELSIQSSREYRLFIKLFKSWLGIYAPDKNIELCDLGVNAIAQAQLIQPRPSLRIISQLSLYR